MSMFAPSLVRHILPLPSAPAILFTRTRRARNFAAAAQKQQHRRRGRKGTTSRRPTPLINPATKANPKARNPAGGGSNNTVVADAPFVPTGPPRYGRLAGEERAGSSGGSGSGGFTAEEATIGANDARNAILILGVFPVIGIGALLAVREDLREEVMESWSRDGARASRRLGDSK